MAGEAAPDEGAAGGAPGAPESPFLALCIGLTVQIQVALGLRPHPESGKPARDLPSAKRGIDLLDALESKTKGNLDADESAFLGSTLYELRMAYVRAVQSGR